MDTISRLVPRSVLAERKVYTLNGNCLGSYLEVTSHTLVPAGLYPLECVSMEGGVAHLHNDVGEDRERSVSYQFWTYEGRVIHFPLDQQVQMQAFFHALLPDPIEVLDCYPDGNRSYSSHYAVLDAGCTIEHLYRWLMNLYEQNGQRFPQSRRSALYRLLWEMYFLEYPDLLRVAASYDGFRDRGEVGSSCTYRPWSPYQDQLQDPCVEALAIASAVWHYQHQVLWSIPPPFPVRCATLLVGDSP
jgi:hypothetical protein